MIGINVLMKISGRQIHFFKHAMCIRSRSGRLCYQESIWLPDVARLRIRYELYNKNKFQSNPALGYIWLST